MIEGNHCYENTVAETPAKVMNLIPTKSFAECVLSKKFITPLLRNEHFAPFLHYR